ncbi:MAG TPA: nucleoside hydrolase [Patescibacteria group bacterium]|nr:nucleoside hydrolase [Patescibacteria group bacterium]
MTPIIVDTDMGPDDIAAISLLLLSKRFSIKAISTVNGLATAATGATNMARILRYVNRTDIPIISGATKPLKERKVNFPEIDRKRSNNLAFLSELPLSKNSSTEKPPIYKSLNTLYQIAVSQKQKPKLICLGPLTNIAKLVRKKPDFVNSISSAWIMAGAFQAAGNKPPENIAEYNIAIDPESAEIVFQSDLKINLVPLDVTRFVPAGLSSFNRKVSRISSNSKLKQILKAVIMNNLDDYAYFYDPLLVAILENQSLVLDATTGYPQVVLAGNDRGRTILKTKSKIITNVNSKNFYQYIINNI